MKTLNVRFDDKDNCLVEYARKKENTSDYIRELIRKDMVAEKEKDILVSATPKDNRLDKVLENLDEVYSIVKRIERSIPDC